MSNLLDTELTATGRQWPDQLVVGLQHLREVRDVLEQELGAKVADPPCESRELGLALLTLTDLSATAIRLRERRSADGSDPMPALVEQAMLAYPGPATIPDLDLLMAVLRGVFVGKYQGWTPTLGKNRLIRGVEGLPEIGGGGQGDPVPWTTPTFQLPPVTGDLRRRIRIGVIDTPIFAHPALRGRYTVAGPDAFLSNDVLGTNHVPFRAGHATFMAGLILQQAPDAELEIRTALDPTTATASTWDVATTMVQFRGSVDILNMSFGCATDDGRPPLLLARAIEQLSPEMVLIAAAGNHGDVNEPVHAGQQLPKLNPRTPYWPAAHQDVWAVGALDGGKPAKFSPLLPWVEFTAPGVNVGSTYLPGQVDIPDRTPEGTVLDYSPQDFGAGYARWSGTSVATATRSGELAAWAQRRSCTPRDMEEFLLRRSVTGHGGDSRTFHTD